MTVKNKTTEKRLQLVAGFVLPEVKSLIQQIADREGRTASQVLRKLLDESPRVKIALRNGRGASGNASKVAHARN